MPPRRVLVLAGVIAGAFAAAAILLPHSPSELRALLVSLGPAAPALALAAWILLTPALFPGTVLAAACGLAFGALGGGALAVVGATAGGLAAFALARTAARGPVTRLVEGRPRLARLHDLLERRGFHAILAARLMPGVPATGLHYAAGVAPVRARAFIVAIAIGALLRTVPYAVLGQGLASGSTTTLALAGISIVIGAVAAGLLARTLRRPVADVPRS
jgi:uncharacterized membrane protein YdjX (TVP38/TMEM64 family)